MTEWELLEYIKHWAIVNMDSDGNVSAFQLRHQIANLQNKMPAFGYDVPEGVFD
jgi:N-acetyl-anhydromuramyl-L-alanine amidase AmpD